MKYMNFMYENCRSKGLKNSIGFLAPKVALKNCQECTHSHIEIMSACLPYYLSTYSQSNLLKNKRAALLLLLIYFF